MALLEFARIVWPKLQASLPNGSIGDRDPPFAQHLFDLTEAETESMVEPTRVTDNVGGKALRLVPEYLLFHTGQPAKPEFH